MNIDKLAINTIKVNGVAAVNKANSGHPGIVLGAATIMHTLFSKHLKYDPKNPKWINRDRFILSAGHGSALLYAQLRLLELVTKKEIMNFRQLDSKTPGHPEFGLTKGVEATTGPLGQGIGIAVGLAVAEAHLRAKFKEIDHHVYVLCGDGDLQEGVAHEALSFAGHQKLNKLIVLHDSNGIQLDSEVKKTTSDDLKLRMQAIGFEYILVKENNVVQISKAIKRAKTAKKPTFIEIKTIIGEGTLGQGTTAVHGAPIGQEAFVRLKRDLKWKYENFEIPNEVKTFYKKTIFKRGEEAYKKWVASEGLKKYLQANENHITISLKLAKNQATRVSSGKVISHLNETLPTWIGGSADLTASTKAAGGDGAFAPTNRKGRNILFGVREFAMGAIANGLALHSVLKPFVSTFFVFSDYLKPAIRLAALMKLPVTYIFTHDSVFVGEDGPTHQPIEQLAMLRSIPNLSVIRPADENEVLGAYEVAVNSTDMPTAIVLTRQNIVSLEETNKAKVKNGAYYLLHVKNSPWTLLATGSELANAYKIGKKLNFNVVSITNFAAFKRSWAVEKAISIEAATTFGWGALAKYNLGINDFGASAPGELVYKKYKLPLRELMYRIKKITGRK